MNLSSTYRPEDDLSHVTSPDLTSDLVEFGTPVNHGTSELNTMFIDEELREDDNTQKHSGQDMFGKKPAPKTTEQTPPKRGWMQKARAYVLPLAVLLGTAVSTSSCDNDDPKPKPKTEEPVKKFEDTPEAREAFEKTLVKPIFTFNGKEIAKQDFELHLQGNQYVLETKPNLYVDPCLEQLEKDAQSRGYDVEKCFVYYSFTNNANLRRTWGIPYNVLSSNIGGILNLNSEELNQYLTISSLSQGHPSSTFVKKGQSGFLSIGTSAPDYADMTRMITINPYIIGN